MTQWRKIRRTPEVKANHMDNCKRKAAEANEQRRRTGSIESKDKHPKRSSAGNQGDRQLWNGTGGSPFHDWNYERLPLMSGFWISR
eukprot:3462104-Heterocapsa_arctica.AAC.1